MAWFNELCRKTTRAADGGAPARDARHVDVVDLLAQVRVPTLVIHARQDDVVPLAEGRLLASPIPGAQFVELESKNHVLLEDEPAWERFQEVVLDFMGVAPAPAGEDAAVRVALAARARDPRADHRGAGQRRDRRAAGHQREDGAQPHLEPLRQARRLDARAGDRLRAGPRFHAVSDSSVIPSVSRGTWAGGAPCTFLGAPARPGPSTHARDDID